MTDAPAAVELRGVTKRFGAVLANDCINLRVAPRTIHGIIGENGAGKTTAMNLLYGLSRPDAGEILLDGKSRRWTSPSDAIAHGLGMVHQHFMLAGPYSALDNILVGGASTRWGIINRRTARAELEALMKQYRLPVDLDRPIEQLPLGAQQRIEILKLLFRQANILILDEPTAVLIPQETTALFEQLQLLRAEGKTVLLVTHKLKEIMAVTDRVTVFRGGKAIAELATSQTNAQELADLMVGRKVNLGVAVPQAQPRPEFALEVSDLTLKSAFSQRDALSRIHLNVRRGEIVGICGVEGNGQSELLQVLIDPRESRSRMSGSIRLLGHDVTNWNAARIRALELAIIPEDRQHEGLLLERPALENFLLGLQRRSTFSRAGFLRRKPWKTAAARALDAYDVRPRDLQRNAGNLSGGNQQKLIIAREFEKAPSLIIAAQPTRGVDVGAIEFIHEQLIRARDRGAGILLISSELEEIRALSDRILVLFEGRFAAEFRRGAVSEGELGLKMGGG